MALMQTVKVRVDPDTRRLIALTETLRDGMLGIAKHLEELARSFDALTTSLAELEEDDGGPDTAHRR